MSPENIHPSQRLRGCTCTLFNNILKGLIHKRSWCRTLVVYVVTRILLANEQNLNQQPSGKQYLLRVYRATDAMKTRVAFFHPALCQRCKKHSWMKMYRSVAGILLSPLVTVTCSHHITVKLYMLLCKAGPGCSKLMTSLVNVSLKFQTLISNICQYFLLKKASLIFSTKILVYLVIK